MQRKDLQDHVDQSIHQHMKMLLQHSNTTTTELHETQAKLIKAEDILKNMEKQSSEIIEKHENVKQKVDTQDELINILYDMQKKLKTDLNKKDEEDRIIVKHLEDNQNLLKENVLVMEIHFPDLHIFEQIFHSLFAIR